MFIMVKYQWLIVILKCNNLSYKFAFLYLLTLISYYLLYIYFTCIFGVVGIDLTVSLSNSPQYNIGLHNSLSLTLLTLIISPVAPILDFKISKHIEVEN